MYVVYEIKVAFRNEISGGYDHRVELLKHTKPYQSYARLDALLLE